MELWGNRNDLINYENSEVWRLDCEDGGYIQIEGYIASVDDVDEVPGEKFLNFTQYDRDEHVLTNLYCHIDGLVKFFLYLQDSGEPDQFASRFRSIPNPEIEFFPGYEEFNVNAEEAPDGSLAIVYQDPYYEGSDLVPEMIQLYIEQFYEKVEETLTFNGFVS